VCQQYNHVQSAIAGIASGHSKRPCSLKLSVQIADTASTGRTRKYDRDHSSRRVYHATLSNKSQGTRNALQPCNMGHDKLTSNIRRRDVLLLPCNVTLSTMSNKSAKLGTVVTVAEAQPGAGTKSCPLHPNNRPDLCSAVIKQIRHHSQMHPCMHALHDVPVGTPAIAAP
jgi:hypothetical protein